VSELINDKGAIHERLMGDHCGCAVCFEASQEIERLRAVMDRIASLDDTGNHASNGDDLEAIFAWVQAALRE
jgi:hypothetical protein